MKALLAGGPAQGVVDTRVETADGRCWTVFVVHVGCACKWCQDVDDRVVTHVYEARDDDVFAYRRSRAATDEERAPGAFWNGTA